MHLPDIPARRGGRRRDRHGRGLRGPLIPSTHPAARTRAQEFDRMVSRAAGRLLAHNPGLRGTEFGVEEIPPSDPSPWEPRTVALGRAFPADRTTGVAARIVIYRRPVIARTEDPGDLPVMVGMVLAEEAAAMLGLNPWDVDPDYPED